MKYKYLLLLLVLGLVSCGVSTNSSISENDSQTSLSENSESLPFIESETVSDSSKEESESLSDPDSESNESTSDVDSESSESHISEEESETEESTSEPPEEKEEVDIDFSKTQFTFDESLKEDEELAYKAVEMCGSNYEHVLDKYKQRRDFQLMAVINNPNMLHHLSEERLEDYDFLLEACKKEKYCLSYIENEELKNKIEKELELDKKKTNRN